MDLVIGGVSTDIWLNSTQEIPEADKKVITHALGDWSLAEEIDLTLFYEIDGKETQVHKTNGPITVKIALPDLLTYLSREPIRLFVFMRAKQTYYPQHLIQTHMNSPLKQIGSLRMRLYIKR